jgi:solute carrier family 34 (sodium-dependent phosphate cotransporter)
MPVGWVSSGGSRPERQTSMDHENPSQTDRRPTPPAGTVTGEALAPPPPPVQERPRWLRVALKALSFLAAVFLFILAIQLMKEGARAFAPRLQGTFPVDNMVSTLGLGWLGAYLVLSGSPVAAAALTLFAVGTTNELQTFTMLTGSRLGASFIVLLVGFLYAIRSRNRKESIGMGVLALSMTAAVYVPGMLVGYGLLKAGVLGGIHWQTSAELNTVIDAVWGPLVNFAADVLPGPLLFPVGLAVILASFKLLDQVLPSLDGERHAESRRHWLKRPWPMFGLGCLAALLTLSVSVALTVLVPLASKGYIDRREAIPYIAGANITTLADTLVAAMILGNPVGVQVVLAEAIGVAAVTLVLLAVAYRPLSRGILALEEWIVATTPRLVLFVAGLFVLPVGLLFSGRLL